MAAPQDSVAYLGPKASYSHQAALSAFHAETHSLYPQHTIEDIFEAVQLDRAQFGVVPIENSTNGPVVTSLDLFADAYSKYPDICIFDEVFVDVHHCLLGHKSSSTKLTESPISSGSITPTYVEPSPPQSRMKPRLAVHHIKKLYSHPQAWGQCNAFLTTHLKGIERQDVSSTSRAAELVTADTSNTTAAISSIVAAEVLDLDILAENIEDRSNNTTRFFLVRKSKLHQESQNRNSMQENKDGSFKTMVSFTVAHDNPGALANALAVFQKYTLNLSSINTRPSGTVSWNYIFLVEIRGLRNADGSGVVNAALHDLAEHVTGWRWLGSWPTRS